MTTITEADVEQTALTGTCPTARISPQHCDQTLCKVAIGRHLTLQSDADAPNIAIRRPLTLQSDEA